MFWERATGPERLSAWRDFRKNFPKTGTEHDVVQYFADLKPEPRYLDYYTPDSWPGVFEIVHNGYFCQSGITLIMVATLQYLNFIKNDKIRLSVISNSITGTEGLVFHQNQQFYNFISGEIVCETFVKDNGVVYDSHIITIDKLLS